MRSDGSVSDDTGLVKPSSIIEVVNIAPDGVVVVLVLVSCCSAVVLANVSSGSSPAPEVDAGLVNSVEVSVTIVVAITGISEAIVAVVDMLICDGSVGGVIPSVKLAVSLVSVGSVMVLVTTADENAALSIGFAAGSQFALVSVGSINVFASIPAFVENVRVFPRVIFTS